ncbi:MAG: hypothetical protein ACRDV6_09170 [Acidimicrobiales bacterium]
MTGPPAPDPLYVAARAVLLDAVALLAPHSSAIILVGAQAVYLRTGHGQIGLTIAPYTTDVDLAIDPTLLQRTPDVQALMTDAGFTADNPGMWQKLVQVGDTEVIVPVDLIVPEGASTGEGRRAARIPPHGKKSARRAVGLEAALVDHSPMAVGALDPSDGRQVAVEVAGPAALLVAKAHEVHDRAVARSPRRLSNKDAADVYRIMQSIPPTAVTGSLVHLLGDPRSSETTGRALDYMDALFGRRAGEGVDMAQQALHLAVDPEQVATLCVAFTGELRKVLS